jgi:putative FmdB family regulatory protein
MPVYEYRCARGHITTELRHVSERLVSAQCPHGCGIAEKVILSAPRVFGDFEGYESPVSGRWIEGRRQRAEDFARTGTRAYEPGDRAVAERNRRDLEAKQDAWVDECVERTAAQLDIRE